MRQTPQIFSLRMVEEEKKVRKAGVRYQDRVLQDYGYILGNEIGQGSYAVVKLAVNELNKEKYAVKIVNKVVGPTEYVTKFLPRELDVMKRVRHRHIVTFYQAIETTRRLYIIMEYVRNGTLLDKIKEDRYIDEERSRMWFAQLLSAIEYLHSRFIVHRDIKCENVLLDADWTVKLGDFGFARDWCEQVASSTYCGSYCYAAPEVLRGSPYDAALADLWSAGVVLYAMLFGTLPFQGGSVSNVLKKMQRGARFRGESNVSAEAKGLISRLLVHHSVRPSIHQLKHAAWLTRPLRWHKSSSFSWTPITHFMQQIMSAKQRAQ